MISRSQPQYVTPCASNLPWRASMSVILPTVHAPHYYSPRFCPLPKCMPTPWHRGTDGHLRLVCTPWVGQIFTIACSHIGRVPYSPTPFTRGGIGQGRSYNYPAHCLQAGFLHTSGGCQGEPRSSTRPLLSERRSRVGEGMAEAGECLESVQTLKGGVETTAGRREVLNPFDWEMAKSRYGEEWVSLDDQSNPFES